jgi:hypothetical protein
MVGPAAAAQRLTIRIGSGLVLSTGLAVLEAWTGIALAFYTDWPSSFWITALSASIYLSTHIAERRSSPIARRCATRGEEDVSGTAIGTVLSAGIVDVFSGEVVNAAELGGGAVPAGRAQPDPPERAMGSS